ncbi:MAG: ribonuclease III [Clostridia bacterium]|nr:ribonuclease III [Clostridia bacterium]
MTETLLPAAVDTAALSPLALAFIGDTVFDLLVRGELLSRANQPVSALHQQATRRVCAAAQAASASALLPLLTEEETAVFKRGRNAHPGGIPKHASAADYHYATGLECLFGWLYLRGELARIRLLFDAIPREGGQTDAEK